MGERMWPIVGRCSTRGMRAEKGFTLIEVIIAMALLGIVGVALLSGMLTSYLSVSLADELATAESLARTEMEYVRNQAYSVCVEEQHYKWDYELPSGTTVNGYPSWWSNANHVLPAGYEAYTVSVVVEALHPTDDGIQKMTVIVKHRDKPDVVTLVGYRSL